MRQYPPSVAPPPAWSPVPLHQRVNRDVDALPQFLRDALIAELGERAYGFEGGEFEAATSWFDGTVDKFKRARLPIGFDQEEIQIRAEKLADISVRLGSHHLIEQMALRFDLDLTKGNRHSTPETIAKRYYEPRAWRKSMNRNWTRTAENLYRSTGFVHRREQLYCTDQAVQGYLSRARAHERYLKARTVSDGEGCQLELWDVVQKSLSNKSNRRTELMTRMRGFEDYGNEESHVPTFITATAPSRFHARYADGKPNEKYAGASVRDAQAWLCKYWARARARFHKLGVVVYGFRIAEPHHDGTPHWHLVLFCEAHHRGLLRAVLRSQWLSDDGAERGASEHRIEFMPIDNAKGSATGYISKYIAKNIDGHEVDEDFEQAGVKAKDSAIRVTAWASLHGIRQFQQIGGPSVSVYRECRRQRTAVDLPTIEPIRAACDAHLVDRFIILNGGIAVGRHGKVGLCKVETDKKNPFGEQREPLIVGVESATEILETRHKTWTIKIATPKSIDSSDPRSGSASRAWSVAGSVSHYSRYHTSWDDDEYQSAPALLRLFSTLGPVSITVPAGPGSSEPRGWTNPNETSTYGPH